jgi:molybdopterin-guanine dinucleotide biosynthesis protein A
MLLAIFVGGASSRMGGTPKGLLSAPSGEPIATRWATLGRALGMAPILVGEAAAYAHLALPSIADEGAHAGPLGGLVAALAHAGTEPVFAVACDMPHVTEALLARLAAAHAAAPVVAARRDDRWEPFFARYDAARVLPLARERLARGALGLQGLLDAAGATALALSPAEEALLADWDAPSDITARRGLLSSAP